VINLIIGDRFVTFAPQIITFSLNVDRVADLNLDLVPVPRNELVEAAMSSNQASHVSVLGSANNWKQPKTCVENTRSAGVECNLIPSLLAAQKEVWNRSQVKCTKS
jgi:hypothetical protein